MCGIISYISDRITYDKDIQETLSQLITCNTVRGIHSTGIMYEDDVNVYTYKRPLAGYDFVQLGTVQRVLRDFNRSRFLIGHNRAATVGAVNQANAHPFQHGHITGVHNGTLINHRTLTKGTFNSPVDSEYIFKALSETDKTSDVIDKINGAFALFWYNGKEDTIHFVRNEERPYTFAKIKDENTLIGASEKDMVMWIAKRNHLAIEKTFTPKALTELVFDLNSENVTKARFIKHKGYVKPVNTGHSGGGTGYQKPRNTRGNVRNLHGQTTTSTTSTTVEFTPTTFISNKNMVNTTVEYGRYIGTTSADEEVIVYHCTKGELQIGQWYEGLCNKNDMLDGKFTVQRTSVKAIQAGPNEEDLFNCINCNDMKFTQEVLFVDDAPVCYACCQQLNVDYDSETVEFRPPQRVSNEEKLEHNVR